MSKDSLHQNSLPVTVHGELLADRLDSWKQIAGFFGREVRTVQLWEKHESLPVRRHNHNKLGTVFAYRSELKTWWNARCSQPSAHALLTPSEFPDTSGLTAHPKLQLASTEGRLGHTVEDASYACMMGKYFWKQRSRVSLKKALRYYNNALQSDHQCANAHAGISDCYVSLAYHQMMPTKDAMSRAIQASRAAVQSDGTSPVSHRAHANVLLSFHWDIKSAEKACCKSIEYDSSNVDSLILCSMLLSIQGRDEEAIRCALNANRLDPISATSNNMLASAYYQAGDYKKAIEVSYRTIELQPDLIRGHIHLGLALAAQGQWNAAESIFIHASFLCERAPYALALLAFVQVKLHRTSQAKTLLTEIYQPHHSHCMPWIDLAAVHAALYERQEVAKCLTNAFENRDMKALFLRRDSRFDGLRSEPGYQRIVNYIGRSDSN